MLNANEPEKENVKAINEEIQETKEEMTAKAETN